MYPSAHAYLAARERALGREYVRWLETDEGQRALAAAAAEARDARRIPRPTRRPQQQASA